MQDDLGEAFSRAMNEFDTVSESANKEVSADIQAKIKLLEGMTTAIQRAASKFIMAHGGLDPLDMIMAHLQATSRGIKALSQTHQVFGTTAENNRELGVIKEALQGMVAAFKDVL